jgi:hypothetical protein
MKGWYNIWKSINIIQHTNKIKDKNHITISIDTQKKKPSKKIQHPFMIKILVEIRNKRNIPQHYKGYTKWEKTKTIYYKIRNDTGVPTLPLLFSMILEFVTRAVRQEKEMKGIQIGKEEVKLSLFADNVILYLKDVKHSTKKTLRY